MKRLRVYSTHFKIYSLWGNISYNPKNMANLYIYSNLFKLKTTNESSLYSSINTEYLIPIPIRFQSNPYFTLNFMNNLNEHNSQDMLIIYDILLCLPSSSLTLYDGNELYSTAHLHRTVI